MMRYRLLDTTRAYALEISVDDAELAISPCATRPTTGDGWSRSGPNGRPCRPGRNGAPHFAALNNVRAALEWCFGVNGEC